MTKRDITGAPRFDGQRDADQLGLHGVEPRGFRIDGDAARLACGVSPALQLLNIGHELVRRCRGLRCGAWRLSGRAIGLPVMLGAQPRQQTVEILRLQKRD